MRVRSIKFISGIFLSMGAVGPSFANLLINPGFETGNFSGWTVGGPAENGVATLGTPAPGEFWGDVNVRSGSYAAYGIVRGGCCISPEPIILSQTVAVAPFQIATIGFYASNSSATGVGAYVGDYDSDIEIYVNGVPILFGGYLDFNNDKTWYKFEGDYINDASTTIDIKYQFIASGMLSFPVSLDDFFVNVTPSLVSEPSSLLLAIAGGLGLSVLGGKFPYSRSRRLDKRRTIRCRAFR